MKKSGGGRPDHRLTVYDGANDWARRMQATSTGLQTAIRTENVKVKRKGKAKVKAGVATHLRVSNFEISSRQKKKKVTTGPSQLLSNNDTYNVLRYARKNRASDQCRVSSADESSSWTAGMRPVWQRSLQVEQSLQVRKVPRHNHTTLSTGDTGFLTGPTKRGARGAAPPALSSLPPFLLVQCTSWSNRSTSASCTTCRAKLPSLLEEGAVWESGLSP